MKCPLITLGVEAWAVNPPKTECDCLKEVCAWFLEDIQMCSIRDLALEMRYTQLRLQDIAKGLTLIRPK